MRLGGQIVAEGGFRDSLAFDNADFDVPARFLADATVGMVDEGDNARDIGFFGRSQTNFEILPAWAKGSSDG
jgi:hypothetical protein